MFHVFQNSTTGYAEEVMDNLYHSGQGDRLPMGGVNLENTTSVFDIGTASYYWNKVYCDNINVYSSITSTNIVRRAYDIIYPTTTVSRIEIAGLNGDSYNYGIGMFLRPSGSSALLLRMNGNSTQSDHVSRYLSFNFSGATIYSAQTTGTFFQMMENVDGGASGYFYGEIYSRTGYPRIIDSVDIAESTPRIVRRITHVWGNSSDTLTSIVINLSTVNVIGSRIVIWEFPL